MGSHTHGNGTTTTPIPTAGFPEGLPRGLRPVLAKGKLRLFDRRRAEERNKREWNAREEVARREHWEAFSAFAIAELGEDLSGCVVWHMPDYWASDTCRHVVEIRVPGLAVIQARYEALRAGDESIRWSRDTWTDDRDPWAVVGGLAILTGNAAASNTLSTHDDLGEALAVAQMVFDKKLVEDLERLIRQDAERGVP